MARCLSTFSRSGALLACGLLSGLSPALAHVTVSVWPSRPEIMDNQTVRFRAEVTGADPGTRCRWVLNRPGQAPGGPELGTLVELGPDRVEYAPPQVAATDYFILRAIPDGCAEPRNAETALIEVSPSRPPGKGPALPETLLRLVAAYAPGEMEPLVPPESALPGGLLDLVFEFAPEEGGLLLPDARVPRLSLSEFGISDQSHGRRLTYKLREGMARMRSLGRFRDPEQGLVLGYGCPLRLRWNPVPEAAGCWLAYLAQANGPGCRTMEWEVRGLREKEIRVFAGGETVFLQSVLADPHQPGRWICEMQSLEIAMRGQTSLAGNPDQDPGHADARGLEARFDAPFGVALVEPGPFEPWGRGFNGLKCVVTDPGRHTVRVVYEDGHVHTLWGQDRVAGFRNGKLGEALFDHPTYVAPGADAGAMRSTDCFLSDSHNNVIRRLAADGEVTTYAGVPGAHPFADGPRAQATFRDPRGLAVAGDRTLYVADRGHGLIRRIQPSGEVGTIAGVLESFGSEDGPLGTGRFTDLRGIALAEAEGALYILDGRGLRRLNLADGHLATVRGSVSTAGRFGAPGQGLLDPCFDDPVGLAHQDGQLHLTDRGQHLVAQFHPPSFTGRILVGDPDQPVSAPGLFRDGLAVFPGAGYATVRRPACLCAGRHASRRGLVLASDRWISQLWGFQWRPTGPVEPELTFQAPERDGEPCVPILRVPHTPVAGEIPLDSDLPLPPDFEYTANCIDSEGRDIGQPLTGSGHFARPVRVTGLPLTGYRDGRVRVRYVTTSGFSAAVEREVKAESPAP